MTNPLTGKCRFCKSKVWLKDSKWLHDGIGALVHSILYWKERAK